MENFLNRIEICYFNIIQTNDINYKEKYLNNLFKLIQLEHLVLDLINYLYTLNPKKFIDYLYENKMQYILFLTYDLNIISNLIEIDISKYTLIYEDKIKIIYNGNNDDESIIDTTEPIDKKWSDI